VVARLTREEEVIGCSTMEKIVHEELVGQPRNLHEWVSAYNPISVRLCFG
jgi:hypothetical protein